MHRSGRPGAAPRAKHAVRDLAVYGGTPLFGEALHVGRPNVGAKDAFLSRVSAALDSRWLTNDGPLVREFEERVAGLTGVAHCVATCNATLGLQILGQACGLSGEVIMPAFTFVATAHAFAWLGLTPVFADVDRETATIDPAHAARLVTSRTTGIVGVHLWGRACDTTGLAELARTHDLTLCYDAAHALACTAEGRPIGGFGRAEVFSFHATKFVNSFEGGAITTDDAELAERLRALRNFGYDRADHVTGPGTNAKMSEAAAAMGLASLDTLPDLVAANTRNHARYRAGLAGVTGVRLREHFGAGPGNHQYVVAEVDPEETGVDADRLARVLWAENVLARRYFQPGCDRLEPYRGAPDRHAPLPLPATRELSARALALPTGTAVGDDEIDGVCEVIRLAVTDRRPLPQESR